MELSSYSRRVRAGAVALALFAPLTLSAANPALAVARPDMAAKPDETTTESFPPLLAVAPTSGTVDLDPETCSEPEVLFCDNVPIEVLASGDLSIEVAWADLDAGNDDIDIILYNSGAGGSFAKLGASESANRPEQIAVRVGRGVVNLVVVHFAGANDGYSISTIVGESSGPPPTAAVAVPRQQQQPPPASSASPSSGSSRPASPTGSQRRSAPIPDRAGAETDFLAPLPGATAPSVTPADSFETPRPGARVERASGPELDRTGDLGSLAWIAVVLFPVLLAAILFGARLRKPRGVA